MNEREIVVALRAAGCSVEHLDWPADLLCGRDGRTFLLEVKSTDARGRPRKQSPAQRRFAERWKGHYRVVKSPAEALEAVGVHAARESIQPLLRPLGGSTERG